MLETGADESRLVTSYILQKNIKPPTIFLCTAGMMLFFILGTCVNGTREVSCSLLLKSSAFLWNYWHCIGK